MPLDTTSHFGGLIEIRPTTYTDDRGFFRELGRDSELASLGLPAFVQTNLSASRHGVLRGVHYQLPPAGQAKLVACAHGAIVDVAVDLRRGSPTFAESIAVRLDAETGNMLFVPEGFGHGFVSASDETVVLYRTSAEFDLALDRAVRWDDPDLSLPWPRELAPFVISEKDAAAPLVADAELFEWST